MDHVNSGILYEGNCKDSIKKDSYLTKIPRPTRWNKMEKKFKKVPNLPYRDESQDQWSRRQD